MNTEMLMQYITYALGGIGILAFLVERSCTGDKGNAGTEKDPDQCGGTCSVTDPDTSGGGGLVHLLWNCN